MDVKNSIRPASRTDIDGLRAVAVLAVIAFHAFPSLMPGGFIGVDIFFVISGFLITTLIIKGQEQSNFNFRAFYASRVRRLFPSLILVLLACQIFGWFGLLSDEYKALGEHVAASAVFIPNLVFWSESGYFDYAAAAKPLLHLWSLGIEAQFNLLWPAMIWLSMKCKLSLQNLAVATLHASLLFNLFMIETEATATFFSPLSRMWELLAGCMLAFFIKNKTSKLVSKVDKNFILYFSGKLTK
jgi:peptidoglycan/LPS O-acetylase OafA/YrhL